VALARACREKRFVEAGLLLCWSHLVVQSERHVTLAVVITMPIIAEHFTAWLRQAAGWLAARARFNRAALDWYRGIRAIDAQLSGAAVYVGVAVFFLLLLSSAAVRGTWAGRLLPDEFDAHKFPIGAVTFIESALNDPAAPFHRQLGGNSFATDQWGGYLIYRLAPRVKVFFDGRSDFYRQGRVLDDALGIQQLKPDVAALLDRYDVQWMLLRKDEPLAAWGHAGGAWQSAYRDETAELFVRKE
jgi:hypothetical protein